MRRGARADWVKENNHFIKKPDAAYLTAAGLLFAVLIILSNSVLFI